MHDDQNGAVAEWGLAAGRPALLEEPWKDVVDRKRWVRDVEWVCGWDLHRASLRRGRGLSDSMQWFASPISADDEIAIFSHGRLSLDS